jgi:sugar lactone lactonase YvrE
MKPYLSIKWSSVILAVYIIFIFAACKKNSSGNTVTNMGAGNGTTVAGTGTTGSALNQFGLPNKISFDGAGNLYVSDATNSRVTKWAPGATTGVAAAGNDTAGSNLNELNEPKGIFSDASGDLYIADQGNSRVVEWTAGAVQGTVVAGGNDTGSSLNDVAEPNGVYVDATGNVYVSDSYNNWVVKWAPGATTGAMVAGFDGASGIGVNALSSPRGITVDASGNIYVVDQGNNRVMKWAPGATQGTLVAGSLDGSSGSGLNQLDAPTGIFVDKSGNIYIADYYNNRVVKWAPNATAGVLVAGNGVPGNALYELDFPNDVYVEASGDIYVADSDNYRIMEWPAK